MLPADSCLRFAWLPSNWLESKAKSGLAAECCFSFAKLAATAGYFSLPLSPFSLFLFFCLCHCGVKKTNAWHSFLKPFGYAFDMWPSRELRTGHDHCRCAAINGHDNCLSSVALWALWFPRAVHTKFSTESTEKFILIITIIKGLSEPNCCTINSGDYTYCVYINVECITYSILNIIVYGFALGSA